MFYTWVKKILFLFPPEAAHDLGLGVVRIFGFFHRLGLLPLGPWAAHPRLKRETPFGTINSPVGLAAGFDKNATALWGWQALGFAFVEVGTVTPVAQEGNSRPRLFRLPRFHAVINRMGFNNDGARAVANRIRSAKKQGLKIKVGGNIGKNKDTPVNQAADDYRKAAREFRDCADYLVINVSSPNTPGLRDLQSQTYLEDIVRAVKEEVPSLPVFIKVAPDNFAGFIDGVVATAKKFKVAGMICGNTLANHASAEGVPAENLAGFPDGGLSGRPIFSLNVKLCEAYAVRAPDLYLIGVGGIGDSFQAIRYFQAGADLVQVYSSFVYEGPSFVKKLLTNLIRNSEQRNTAAFSAPV
jgi:dihydroorotate dehydrogenase